MTRSKKTKIFIIKDQASKIFWTSQNTDHMIHVMRKPVLLHANTKGADQPAHLRSLISAFAAISKISSLYLASVAAQASLSLPWSQTPKTGLFVMRLI